MSCDHKFINDLNLERTDFEPSTLIVGSFYPQWPENNTEWFYGQTHDASTKRINHFWDILPRIYGEPGLMDASPAEWKQFCHEKKLAITCLIRSIDDADPNDPAHAKILASIDDQAIVWRFDDFIFINITDILRKHPTIRNVYLTRGITEAFWRHAWNPVMQYCKLNGLHERRLLSPTAQSRYQHETYNNENPDKQIALLEDYILMRWQQEWHL